MPKIGAHVSAAISLDLAFDRASKIGAQCSQIFVSPPRQWAKLEHDEEEIEAFRNKQKLTRIEPNFIHGTYLINLLSKDPYHLIQSMDWIVYALNISGKLGMDGLIFHLGSHKGVGFESTKNQVIKSLSNIIQRLKSYTPIILENSAGQGGVVGSKFSELGQIVKEVGYKKLKVCLDTCHAFAAGYDLKTRPGLNATLEEFDKEIGLGNLAVIHANDSKFELGSGKDRHANIGEGFIGREGFANLLNHKALKDIPFILEVPGFSGNGPDKENIDLLKTLTKRI